MGVLCLTGLSRGKRKQLTLQGTRNTISVRRRRTAYDVLKSQPPLDLLVGKVSKQRSSLVCLFTESIPIVRSITTPDFKFGGVRIGPPERLCETGCYLLT